MAIRCTTLCCVADAFLLRYRMDRYERSLHVSDMGRLHNKQPPAIFTLFAQEQSPTKKGGIGALLLGILLLVKSACYVLNYHGERVESFFFLSDAPAQGGAASF